LGDLSDLTNLMAGSQQSGDKNQGKESAVGGKVVKVPQRREG